MSALLAITRRELGQRWTLPLAAFCFGFLMLYFVVRYGQEATGVVVLAMVPAAWVVAVLMGASVIAGDLGSGRLAFFFTRPVPWWSIAGGKLLAALLLTLATALAGALPALVAGGNLATVARWTYEAAAGGGLAINLLLLLVLIGLGHAASVVYRSRSPWAALDFALAALTIAAAAAVWRSLTHGLVTFSAGLPALASTGAVRFVLTALLLAAAITLAPAFVQVARGRSDMRRGHRALSLSFWSGALLVLAVAGGYVAWLASLGLPDFPSRFARGGSGDGRFVSLLGMREDRHPRAMAEFLLDTRTGRALRLDASLSQPAFSADDRRAAWLVSPPWLSDSAFALEYAQLSAAAPEVETLELEKGGSRERLSQLALDREGERLALVQSHTLSVHELPSGRLLSRTAASDGEWMAAAFLPDGSLRAFRRIRAVAGSPGRPTIPGFVELLDFAGGVASRAVKLDATGHAILWSPAGGARVLLLEAFSPRVFSLHDAASGHRLRAFSGEGGLVRDAYLFETGDVAVLESDYAGNRLRLVSDGRPDRLVELGKGLSYIGGAPAAGVLSVCVRAHAGRMAGEPAIDSDETLLIDAETGAVLRREPQLVPASPPFGPPPAATAALFVDGEGALIRLDPATGERRVVLKAASGS